MPRSRASSRSRGGGKGRPYAACSRSHQPAPTPTNARPPVSASRVAAALAVMPGGRNVTGVTSVPSSSPVPRPASAPRVTHGSGIGDQARSTCGIWMRWSISASPAKPASSAARATPRSQASGSSPHGNRETWSTTFSPCEVRRSRPPVAGSRRRRLGRPARPRRDRVHDVPALAVELARPARGAASAGRRAPAPAPAGRARRCGAGSRRPGCRGRRRRRAARRPGPAPASAGGGPRRCRGCRRRWSGGGRGGRRRSCSSRANASSEASRSCGPLPTTPRRASEETISSRAVARRRPGGLAGARRPDQDDERRVGKRHTPTKAAQGGSRTCWGAAGAAWPRGPYFLTGWRADRGLGGPSTRGDVAGHGGR